MSNEWVCCVQVWQESVYFLEKTEKPISDMFAVCGVGSVVGACSFHCMQIMLGLQLAGFLHSVQTVFSLFAENANWQISGGQEPELEIWPVVPRTRDVHWTHWRASIYLYADAYTAVNQSILFHLYIFLCVRIARDCIIGQEEV